MFAVRTTVSCVSGAGNNEELILGRVRPQRAEAASPNPRADAFLSPSLEHPPAMDNGAMESFEILVCDAGERSPPPPPPPRQGLCTRGNKVRQGIDKEDPRICKGGAGTR